jgi:biotin carboxyl carrier protein
MKVTVSVDGEERELEITRNGEQLRISYGDHVVDVRVVYTEGPHFVLEYDQQVGSRRHRRRLRAAGYVDGDHRQIWVNGSMVQYERVPEQPADTGVATEASLSASIPAVVSEVLVAPGDSVSAGQKLILLESMKMILPIQAPRDAVVEAINCAPGDAVQPGVQLVTLSAVE